MKLLIAGVVSAATAFGLAAWAGEYMGEAVEMKTLPQPVQTTITEKAAGGEIVKVQREDDKDGKWNYEVVVKTTNGKEWAFEVDPNGKFIRRQPLKRSEAE